MRDRPPSTATGSSTRPSRAPASDDFGEATWQEGLDRAPRLASATRPGSTSSASRSPPATSSTYLANRLGIIGLAPPTTRRSPTARSTRPIVIVGPAPHRHHDPLRPARPGPGPAGPAHVGGRPPAAPARDRHLRHRPAHRRGPGHPRHGRLAHPRVHQLPPDGRPARRRSACGSPAGDFRSMIFPTQYRVPTYNRWLLHEADLAPAYRWHRRFLQHLQSRHPAEQWLLKSPAHLWHLDALAGEYPDAVVVQTHRDPLKVIASVSALAAHLRRMASDEHVDRRGRRRATPTTSSSASTAASTPAIGACSRPSRSSTCSSPTFVADPLATIRRDLRARSAATSPTTTEGRMRRFLAEQPRRRRRRRHPLPVRRHRARRRGAPRAGRGLPGALRRRVRDAALTAGLSSRPRRRPARG